MGAGGRSKVFAGGILMKEMYLQVEFISEPSVHNHPYLWMLTSMHIDIVLMSFAKCYCS